MEDTPNPFAGPPLCRKNEVVTYSELVSMHAELVQHFQKTSWFRIIAKMQLLGAGAMVEGLIDWIDRGKQ